MAVREAELIRNARKPFEMYVGEDDEKVMILSDTGMDPRVWSVLNKAARSIDIEPSVVLMPEADYSYAEAPPHIHDVVLASDVCFLVTSKGFLHNTTGEAALDGEQTIVAMAEFAVETLAGGAASADHNSIIERGTRIQDKWNAGDTVTVTSPLGTELEATIEDTDEEFRTWAFPAGEVPIAPDAGTTNGTIVWDTTMHEIGRIDEPITAQVEDGFVTDIQGGREARKFRDLLSEADDPNVYNIAEISIGINPGAEIVGRLREDKKAWGYLHIAVGKNSDFGGEIDAPLHIDGVIADATLQIDDEVIVEAGDVVL